MDPLSLLAQAAAAAPHGPTGGFTILEYTLGALLSAAGTLAWRVAVAYRSELLERARIERESAAALARADAQLEACRARAVELESEIKELKQQRKEIP